jgi:hypothetical protein
VNEGGSVDYLTPPVQALPVQVAFLRENQDKILEASGMPRVNFGQAPTSSVATGKAINELQGAGTGSTVEMVQGTGIGPELVAWNEKALTMYQSTFKKDTINLYGVERSTLDVNPRNFALTFKGSEIVGSPRNEVVFSPHMNDHEKLVMGLQGVGRQPRGRRSTCVNSSASRDNDAMVEEIFQEQLEEGLLAATLLEMQSDPSEQNAQVVGATGTQIIEGIPSAAAHPLLALGQQQPPSPGGPPAAGGSTFPGAPGGVTRTAPAAAARVRRLRLALPLWCAAPAPAAAHTAGA